MRILKLPKIKLNNDKLHITSKCLCGCKTLIEEPQDVVFIRGFTWSFNSTPEVTFGYTCPSCNTEIELSESANKKIVKYISKRNYINMNTYVDSCSRINIDFEIYGKINCNPDMDIWDMVNAGFPIPNLAKTLVYGDEPCAPMRAVLM